MKIGIIVHSQTGHTYSVAENLKDKLTAAGHTVNIDRIASADTKQADPQKIRIEKLPDISAYDALVLAAPVQAFSVSPVMKAYLPQLPPLNGKKTVIFVTKGLRFNWTGGNGAISRMAKAVESKGGKVIGTGILVWKEDASRDSKVKDMTGRLSKLF
jgi:NAD(P)H dehydrogenase (quinone)